VSFTCRTCGKGLPTSSFHINPRYKRGHGPHCGSCCNARKRAYRATTNGKAATKQSIRRYELRTKFGITAADYDSLLIAQQGVCAICRQPETRINALSGLTQCLAVDHEHSSKRVRGLLCGRCNTAIGLFEDSTALLTAACRYLEFVGGK
jgi:hypothetical protein